MLSPPHVLEQEQEKWYFCFTVEQHVGGVCIFISLLMEPPLANTLKSAAAHLWYEKNIHNNQHLRIKQSDCSAVGLRPTVQMLDKRTEDLLAPRHRHRVLWNPQGHFKVPKVIKLTATLAKSRRFSHQFRRVLRSSQSLISNPDLFDRIIKN